MKRRLRSILLAGTILVLVIGMATAQWGRRGPIIGQPSGRSGVPEWQNDPEFQEDVFTFVRVCYESYSRGWGRRRRWRGGGWDTDFPASDLNFSFRLQQLTSMKVSPLSLYMTLDHPEVFEYPFLYLLEPGDLVFSDEDIEALRRYLRNGGFLMVDDFWGEDEWYNFYTEIRRVFPDREPQELSVTHPIFNCVYKLKTKPQIPSIDWAFRGRDEGRTWERPDAQTPHYMAIYDDKGRIMVLICRNTDLGDGWEREGEHPWYFHEFSEKYAYPLGINIVTYAMTH